MNDSPRHIQQRRDAFILKMKSIQKQVSELKALAEPNDKHVVQMCQWVDLSIEMQYASIRMTTAKLLEEAHKKEVTRLLNDTNTLVYNVVEEIDKNALIANSINKANTATLLTKLLVDIANRKLSDDESQ